MNISKHSKVLIKKTSNLWNMSVEVLNTIILNIAPYLALIFNKCVKSGTFPNRRKTVSATCCGIDYHSRNEIFNIFITSL